ncbi:MAG: class SAM-dependent methyltransferase [Arthrobacter sp.]|nr:class SAM-dependent methyltransferase [Arthrobacter sp.]
MAANNRPRSRCALRGHDQRAKCSNTRYRMRGIGAAVNGLRARGRAAFGVDPTLAVLEVAEDLFNPARFRSMAATAISPGTLASNGLPEAYDAIPMSGNVPSFLTRDEVDATFGRVARLLEPGGVFVVATTTAIQGGPAHQDRAATRAGAGWVMPHGSPELLRHTTHGRRSQG